MSSKRKHKLEPISLQELADTPGMSGFCTFLTRTPEGQAPGGTGPPTAPADNTSEPQYLPAIHTIGDWPVGRSRIGSLPIRDKPVGESPSMDSLIPAPAMPEVPRSESPIGASHIAELPIGTPDRAPEKPPEYQLPIGDSRIGNPPIGKLLPTSQPLGPRDPIPLPILLPDQNDQPPFESPSPSLQTIAPAAVAESPIGNPPMGKLLRPATRVEGNNQARVRRATLAQHAHSDTENAIYDLMWRSGRRETEDTAIFSQGYAILSARVRRDRTVIKRNIATLIEKLAIQVVRPSTTSTPTVYRVFSYRETLNRRRAAGLIWVQRHGVAIHFVLPPEPQDTELPIGDSPAGNSFSDRGLPTGDSRIGNPDLRIGESPTHISNHDSSLENSNPPATPAAAARTPEEPVPPQLVAAYRRAIHYVDDALVRELVAKCRSAEPTATVEEMCDLLAVAAGSVRNNARVENKPKILPGKVAMLFMGESFRQYRAEKRKALQAERAQWEQTAREDPLDEMRLIAEAKANEITEKLAAMPLTRQQQAG